jgi:hypothetical protein
MPARLDDLVRLGSMPRRLRVLEADDLAGQNIADAAVGTQAGNAGCSSRRPEDDARRRSGHLERSARLHRTAHQAYATRGLVRHSLNRTDGVMSGNSREFCR